MLSDKPVMKRICQLTLLLCVVLPFAVQAQNRATRLLDKVVNRIDSQKGTTLSFIIRQSGVPDAEGKIEIQEGRFTIVLPEMSTWFDGTTQWTYLQSTQEVNISTPTPEELAQTNPCLLLTRYKDDFDCRFIGESNHICELLLTPRQESEISEIRLFIDEKSTTLSRLTLLQKGGQSAEIAITRYESNKNFRPEHFVFKEEQFPQATIIDLR